MVEIDLSGFPGVSRQIDPGRVARKALAISNDGSPETSENDGSGASSLEREIVTDV